MQNSKSIQSLSKLLAYVLGRRPDEFGLVPDQNGYVKIKELLKALHEEEGWRYVRQVHLNEICLTLPAPPIEISEKLIRAKTRENLPQPETDPDLPKLLYTCIRTKAYVHVHEKGLFPAAATLVTLSSDKDMALRIGRRSDPSPVVLTIHVGQAIDRGVFIYRVGEKLFLADSLPASCINGPPLPKEKPPAARATEKNQGERSKTPGSYLIDLTDSTASKSAVENMKPGAQKDKHRAKKYKRKRERPPWRR